MPYFKSTPWLLKKRNSLLNAEFYDLLLIIILTNHQISFLGIWLHDWWRSNILVAKKKFLTTIVKIKQWHPLNVINHERTEPECFHERINKRAFHNGILNLKQLIASKFSIQLKVSTMISIFYKAIIQTNHHSLLITLDTRAKELRDKQDWQDHQYITFQNWRNIMHRSHSNT